MRYNSAHKSAEHSSPPARQCVMPASRGAAPGSVAFVPFRRVWQAAQDVLSYPCVELLNADLAQHSKASTSTHKDAEEPSPPTLAQTLSSHRHLSSDPGWPPQLTSRGVEGLSYCPVGHSQALPRGLAEGERAEPSSGLHLQSSTCSPENQNPPHRPVGLPEGREDAVVVVPGGCQVGPAGICGVQAPRSLGVRVGVGDRGKTSARPSALCWNPRSRGLFILVCIGSANSRKTTEK